MKVAERVGCKIKAITALRSSKCQLCIPWLSAGLGLSASCFSPESWGNGSPLTANPQHPHRAQEEELMGRKCIFWDYKIIFFTLKGAQWGAAQLPTPGLCMTTLALHYLSHLHYSGFLSFAQVWLVKGWCRRAFFLFPGLCCGERKWWRGGILHKHWWKMSKLVTGVRALLFKWKPIE